MNKKLLFNGNIGVRFSVVNERDKIVVKMRSKVRGNIEVKKRKKDDRF